MAIIVQDYGNIGGGSSDKNPLLYFIYGTQYPSSNEYRRDDFDDIATVTGIGTNTLTFTFKKSVKGNVCGSGLSNTLEGTATFDANPIKEYSTNPPKHNGQYTWNFEANPNETLIFACGGGWSQQINLCVN